MALVFTVPPVSSWRDKQPSDIVHVFLVAYF